MPRIEVDVEPCENTELPLTRIFDAREEPREVRRLVTFRRDGADGPCAVTGWGAGGPCPAYAARVWDSGDGVAILVYGGDEGIRLRPEESDAPWDLADAAQWGEPCLLLEADAEVG